MANSGPNSNSSQFFITTAEVVEFLYILYDICILLVLLLLLLLLLNIYIIYICIYKCIHIHEGTMARF